MGFESYTVMLTPCPSSPLATAQNAETLQRLVNEIVQSNYHICPDDEEIGHLPYTPHSGEAFLVYKTALGLYQMLLKAHEQQVHISLQFAYCNPRTIYKPFISMVANLMRRYGLQSYVMASDKPLDLCDPQTAEKILTPSMDYNRHLWQADAGMNQEDILRPGEALERFVQQMQHSPVPARQ